MASDVRKTSYSLPTQSPSNHPSKLPSQTQSAKSATMLEDTSPDPIHLACGLAGQVLAALGIGEGRTRLVSLD